MVETVRPKSRLGIVTISAAAVWLIVYLSCRIVLEKFQLLPAARVAVALSPVVPFVVFLLSWIALMRTNDELHRRVQLEALAFAFPATLVVLMIIGLLQLAIELPPHRFALRDIWPIMPILYFAGLAWNWRRYQ